MFDIKGLVRNDIAFIDSHCRLSEAAGVLSISAQVVLPVVDEHIEPVGIITEKNILTWLCSGKDRQAKVSDYMQTEITTIDYKTELVDLVNIFSEENHKEIPVVSNGVLAGLISRGSLIKFLIGRKAAVKI